MICPSPDCVREKRLFRSEIRRLKLSLAVLASQTGDGLQTCQECQHQWDPDINNPPGDLCKGCEGNKRQTDIHHKAEYVRSLQATYPVRVSRAAAATRPVNVQTSTKHVTSEAGRTIVRDNRSSRRVK